MKEEKLNKYSRVLLAENDFIINQFLNWHFKYFDFNVDRCIDRNSLFKKLKNIKTKNNKKAEHNYDLVILDLKLFNSSVLNIIKRKNRKNKIPYLFLTSNQTSIDDIKKIKISGINCLFSDIKDFNEILIRINKLLPLKNHSIEIKKPLFPIKIIFQNYAGFNNIVKTFIFDKASILNTFSNRIKECFLIISNINLNKKLNNHYKLEIYIRFQNGRLMNQNYIFNNNTNIYREIKEVFSETATKLKYGY